MSATPFSFKELLDLHVSLFILETEKLPSQTPLIEFMEWVSSKGKINFDQEAINVAQKLNLGNADSPL